MNYSEAVAIKSGNIHIENFLPKLGIEQVRKDIFEGLQSRNKYISSKFFYDKTGSDLFEQITHLSEYYPTRTEKRIIENLQLNFLSSFKNLNIIELGSGDPSKVSLLLNKVPETNLSDLNYIPVDISASAIEYAGRKLLALFPQINIKGIVADFMKQLNFIPNANNRLFCFLGSTIGNFTTEQTEKFMQNMSEIVEQGEYFLVGFDNIKDIAVLENAYNDEQGITAQFNLNILNVVNRIANTNFDTLDFKHIAFYNTHKNRVEMHLEALRDVEIKSKFLDKEIIIKKGEHIHTENSHKFDKEMISKIANHANFKVETIFTDDMNWFKVALLKKK